MKKILPVTYVLFLYFVLINPFYLNVMDPDLSIWIAAAMGIATVIYSFFIKNDEKAIGFAFYFSTFALIPFYLLVSAMFIFVGLMSSDVTQSVLSVMFTTYIINGFVLLTTGFYGLNYARHHDLSIIHKLLPFVLVFNVIDAIYLSRKMFHVKHD